MTDAWGNTVVGVEKLEVTLQPAAIATDGSGDAAKVAASGTNRVKASAVLLHLVMVDDDHGHMAGPTWLLYKDIYPPRQTHV